MGTIHGGDAFRGDAEETLGTSAAFGGGIAEVGFDVALGLQTVEGGVDGADGYLAVGARFDFLADGDAVGAIGKTEKGQEDKVFKFAEEITGRHYIYNIEEMGRGQGKRWLATLVARRSGPGGASPARTGTREDGRKVNLPEAPTLSGCNSRS